MAQIMPLVTVIIPTYNSSGTLELSLKSVLLQTFSDFEVWVVGDGCSDDTAEVVSRFNDPRVHWMNLPHNSGSPSAPRNEGLRRARGELIAYLGHDDLWFPWHLSELVDCLHEGSAQFACSLGLLLTPQGVVGCFSLPRDFSSGDYLSPSNWMHRKALVETVGLWSQKLKFGDDRDFARRVLAAGTELGFKEKVSVLKYPAAAWRMYSLTDNYPQSIQLEAIRRNPEQLRLDLLQSAGKTDNRNGLRQDHLLPLPGLVRGIIRVVLDWYGHDRWPVTAFEHWRWRRLAGLSRKNASSR